MCFESWNEPFGQSGCDIFLVEVFDEDFIDIARSHTFPPQRSEAGQLARTWLGFGILEIDAWKGCQERVADLKKRDPKQYGWKALEHSTATGSGRRRQSEFQVLEKWNREYHSPTADVRMFETIKSDGSVRREAHLPVLKAYERHDDEPIGGL